MFALLLTLTEGNKEAIQKAVIEYLIKKVKDCDDVEFLDRYISPLVGSLIVSMSSTDFFNMIDYLVI